MSRVWFITCTSAQQQHWIELLRSVSGDDAIHALLLDFNSIYGLHPTGVTSLETVDRVDFAKHFASLDVYRVLRRERPDLIVLLDKGSLLMRAVLLAADRLKIRTLQTQHGLLPDIEDPRQADRQKLSQKIGGKFSRRYLLSQARRSLVMYWVYALAYWHRPPLRWLSPQFWLYTFRLFRDPKLHNVFLRRETRADRAVCFSPRDRRYFEQIEGYASGQIEVISKPEFSAAYHRFEAMRQSKGDARSRMEVRERLGLAPHSRIALLISQPFVEDGLIRGFDWDQKLSHLHEIEDAASKAGFRLVVKLHPRERLSMLAAASQHNMLLVQNEDLTELLYAADAVLGYYSTALVNAVILGHTPLILGWILTDAQLAALDLARHGVACRMQSSEAVTASLNDLPSLAAGPTDRAHFLREWVGEDLAADPVLQLHNLLHEELDLPELQS